MRDQLIHYVDLLFAGAPDAGDIKQEILQNTLDRYDDLIGQGKTPEAAYRLAISGIGDINEILNGGEDSTTPIPTAVPPTATAQPEKKLAWKTALQAIGICLYILCPIPLFAMQNELGLCFLLAIVAVATALMVLSGSKQTAKDNEVETTSAPESEIRKAVRMVISTVGLCLYLILSFATGAWYITWVIFPMMAAAQGLAKAILDLKEVN